MGGGNSSTAGICLKCLCWQESGKQLQQTVVHSLTLVGVPPSACRGGGWQVGAVTAPSFMIHSRMLPHLLGRPHFSRDSPSCRTPHFCLFGCICTANSGPLPRSALWAPYFSTQNPPALANSPLRQGYPRLTPEEALGWAVLRSLEPRWEEALTWEVGEPVQMGAPSSVCRGWSQWVGKGVAMAALPLLCRTMTCFHGVLGFFC